MFGIFFEGKRIGTIGRFVGEPSATRWWAWAPKDRKQGFRLKREAIAWLEEIAAQDAAS